MNKTRYYYIISSFCIYVCIVIIIINMYKADDFRMCAPQSGPLRDVHGVIQRREEGGRRQRWPGG